MAVKADWHVPDLELPEQTKIEDVGVPIDLTSEPTLNRRLVELVQMEDVLHQRGVTCAVKDRDDTACCACPIRSEDPTEPLHQLCALGCEQERVATSLAVYKERPGGGHTG